MKILLLTHGGWGMALLGSIQMILGKIENVEEEALLPQYTFSEYKERVEARVKTYTADSLIITDLFGGTTTNVAALVGRENGIKVVSGLSAPLLLEACSEIMSNGSYNINQLIDAGRNACKDVVQEVSDRLKQKEEK